MKFLIRLFLNTLSVLITSYLLKAGVQIDGFLTALLLAALLGFLNSFVRPILVILTFPITIFSLGLFLFVINALLILLADWILPGFTVGTFWWALLFSLVTSIISAVLNKLAGTTKGDQKKDQ